MPTDPGGQQVEGPVASDDFPSASSEDFARLFADGDTLSPYQAGMLHNALGWIAANIDMDTTEHGDDPVTDDREDVWFFLRDDMPRRTWKMDAAWRTRLFLAACDLGTDLARGELPRPRSVAEEALLWQAVDLASEYEEPEGYNALLGRAEHLSENGGTFRFLVDFLFQDLDIEYVMIEGGHLDGLVDGAAPEELAKLGTDGDRYADARRWFEWWNNVDPRPGRQPHA